MIVNPDQDGYLQDSRYQILNAAGHLFGWSNIEQDLNALKQVTIEEDGKRFDPFFPPLRGSL